MKLCSKNLLIDLAALVCGMALPLAFAPFTIFFLAVFCLAGLFATLIDASAKRAWWRGFLFGIGMFGVGVSWVYHSIHFFGDVPVLPALGITAGFVMVLSLFTAFTTFAMNHFFPYTSTKKILFVMPSLWVLGEWFRSWLFTGFPWLFVGYSQTNSPLKGYAPILGVYGVSLAVAISAACVVCAIRFYRHKAYHAFYYSLLTVFIIWFGGAMTYLIPWTKPNGKPISVSLIQGNIPQAIKWSPEHVQLSLDRYQALTTPLFAKDKLIVWPEAAIPLPLPQATDYFMALNSEAREKGSTLIAGVPVQSPEGNGYYNAVLSLGVNQGKYYKKHLVPFGEYIPEIKPLARIMSIMQIPMSNMVSGKIEQPLLTYNTFKILTTICYEVGFPFLSHIQDPTIGLLLTVSNDAWFGESLAQSQHLQMAQMQAMMLQRPALFVSNNGITAIITERGNVEEAAPQYETYVLNGEIQPTQGFTFWMYNGDDTTLFLIICLIAIAIRAQYVATKTNVNAVNLD